MKLKLLVLLVCCQGAFAQGSNANTTNTPSTSTAAESVKRVIKVVRVRGDAEAIAALAGRSSGVDCQVSSALRAIVLKGPAADVANVERTIQELDSSSPATNTGTGVRNLELTIYIIAGSAEPMPGFEEVSGDALAPVLKQLRAIFPYKHYEVLSTILLRSAQSTGASAQGVIRQLQPPDVNLGPATYHVSYDSLGASTESTSTIHISKLQFTATVPYLIGSKDSKQYQVSNIGISSHLDVREGQKVVVGTSNIPEGNTTVFLVLSARVVQ